MVSLLVGGKSDRFLMLIAYARQFSQCRMICQLDRASFAA
jgi:hypothetical protein